MGSCAYWLGKPFRGASAPSPRTSRARRAICGGVGNPAVESPSAQSNRPHSATLPPSSISLPQPPQTLGPFPTIPWSLPLLHPTFVEGPIRADAVPAAAGAGAERADAAAAKAREDEVASISEKRPIHLRAVTAGIAPPSPSPLVAPPYVSSSLSSCSFTSSFSSHVF